MLRVWEKNGSFRCPEHRNRQIGKNPDEQSSGFFLVNNLVQIKAAGGSGGAGGGAVFGIEDCFNVFGLQLTAAD